MSRRPTHRILGIVYFDPADPRLLVPNRLRVGWTLNFAHPRAVPRLAWSCGLAMFGFLLTPILAHPAWFTRQPVDLIWVSAALGITLIVASLNPWFGWQEYRQVGLAAFGVIAAGMGFTLQHLINGPLVFWWGPKLAWQHHLVLGPVAALAQTFGKWFALALLLRLRTPSAAVQRLRAGLYVGLGFAVWEITLIYFQVAWAQVAVGYLSLWERASASLFHLYSAGLLAVALGSRRWWPVLVVVAAHAAMDFLAGAGGRLGFSLDGLESTFTGCAVLLWAVFLLAGRSQTDDDHGPVGAPHLDPNAGS